MQALGLPILMASMLTDIWRRGSCVRRPGPATASEARRHLLLWQQAQQSGCAAAVPPHILPWRAIVVAGTQTSGGLSAPVMAANSSAVWCPCRICASMCVALSHPLHQAGALLMQPGCLHRLRAERLQRRSENSAGMRSCHYVLKAAVSLPCSCLRAGR
jgi:hypothetical protein